ncbi:hypothetical protein PMIN01_05960 [Paraphaeosphaeria minitans]|uniref:Uncharacterized protein n=1 Tax=Paraphaeosphaeria minitans TaxID=565426 RepID=A0A9P6KRE0_9PLEO|nr:hypothetical protein PMIN01_05960 [Paraphaeosphaeria minitans]
MPGVSRRRLAVWLPRADGGASRAFFSWVCYLAARRGRGVLEVGGLCAKILPQGLGRTRRIRQRALSHRRTQVGKRTQRVAAGGSPRRLVGVTRQDGRDRLEGLVSIKRPRSLQTPAMAIGRLGTGPGIRGRLQDGCRCGPLVLWSHEKHTQ